MTKKMKNTLIVMLLIVVLVLIGLWWIYYPNRVETSVDQGWNLADMDPPPGTSGYVEAVGPAGNSYADPEFYKELAIESLPEPVQRLFRLVVPDYVETQIRERITEEGTFWRILVRTETEDRYFLNLGSEGQVQIIITVIDDILERQGRIFHEGQIQEIPADYVPQNVLTNALAVDSELKLDKAYSVDAEAGHRYFIQLRDGDKSIIVSLTDEGEIRAAGMASSMLRPIVPRKGETQEVISTNLSKYGDKYHIDKVIQRIKKVRFKPSEGFRFVVLGDSRSELIVWQSIVFSINKWEPLFMIDVGDLTPAGSSSILDTYHFATLERYTGYPFLPTMGNHDCGGTQAFEYAFGGEGSRVYYFDYGTCRFVVLDNSDCSEGMLWEEQLELAEKWLSKKKNYRKFVFVHLPPPEVEKWAYHAMSLEMSSPFVKLMSEHEVDHVFAGHIHAYSTASYEGVDYTVTGGAGLHEHYGELGSNHHYVVVDVLRDRIEMKLVRLLPEEVKE